MVLREASYSSLLFSEAHYEAYITFSLYHEPPNWVRFIQRHMIVPILHSVASATEFCSFVFRGTYAIALILQSAYKTEEFKLNLIYFISQETKSALQFLVHSTPYNF